MKAHVAIVIYENEEVPLLKDDCTPSSTKAFNILKDLGFENYESDGIDDEDPEVFCEALESCGERIMIGAYPSGFILATEYLIPAGTAEPCILRDRILKVFGSGTILFFNLDHSFKFYAYALYEKGKLVRAKDGTLDNPVVRDFGAPLSSEKDALDGSQATLLIANAILGKKILSSENPFFPVLEGFYPG